MTNTKRGHVAGQPVPYVNAGHAVRHKSGADYRVDPETGCWLWQKNLRNGYGRKTENGRLCSAHVWYWEQENGPVPDGLDIDHLCHNADKSCPGGVTCPHRACVNPAHLQAVPRTTNTRRGRNAKLTQADVDAIRAYEPHWGYRQVLAEKYGVSRVAITKLRNRSYWPDGKPA